MFFPFNFLLIQLLYLNLSFSEIFPTLWGPAFPLPAHPPVQPSQEQVQHEFGRTMDEIELKTKEIFKLFLFRLRDILIQVFFVSSSHSFKRPSQMDILSSDYEYIVCEFFIPELKKHSKKHKNN